MYIYTYMHLYMYTYIYIYMYIYTHKSYTPAIIFNYLRNKLNDLIALDFCTFERRRSFEFYQTLQGYLQNENNNTRHTTHSYFTKRIHL